MGLNYANLKCWIVLSFDFCFSCILGFLGSRLFWQKMIMGKGVKKVGGFKIRR